VGVFVVWCVWEGVGTAAGLMGLTRPCRFHSQHGTGFQDIMMLLLHDLCLTCRWLLPVYLCL
jgi:hypothetical protein